MDELLELLDQCRAKMVVVSASLGNKLAHNPDDVDTAQTIIKINMFKSSMECFEKDLTDYKTSSDEPVLDISGK